MKKFIIVSLLLFSLLFVPVVTKADVASDIFSLKIELIKLLQQLISQLQQQINDILSQQTIQGGVINNLQNTVSLTPIISIDNIAPVVSFKDWENHIYSQMSSRFVKTDKCLNLPMTNDCNIRRNDEDCRCTLFEYASETFVKYLDNKLWGDVYLGVKVSDIEPSSGISNTEFFIDNNPIGTILYTTKFSNGEHTLSAKVYDKSGNIGESSITIQIKN